MIKKIKLKTKSKKNHLVVVILSPFSFNRLFINATGFPSHLGQYQNLPMTILLVLSSLHLPPHFRQRCALINFHSFAVVILFSPLLVRNSG
jgi:hypothetical protein